MIVQGMGSKDAVEVSAPLGQYHGRIAIEADGEMAVISMDSNGFRVLAMQFEAAADELDRRSRGIELTRAVAP